MAEAGSQPLEPVPWRLSVSASWVLIASLFLVSFFTPALRYGIAWLLNLPVLHWWVVSTLAAVVAVVLIAWFWGLSLWWYARQREDARQPLATPPSRVVSQGMLFVMTFVLLATQVLYVRTYSGAFSSGRHELAAWEAGRDLRHAALEMRLAGARDGRIPRSGLLMESGLTFPKDEFEAKWKFGDYRYRAQDYYITVRGQSPDFIGTQLEARAVYRTRDEFPRCSRRTVRVTITGPLDSEKAWYRTEVLTPEP